MISVHVGGAIFVDKSNVSIIECTFFNNSAEVGGAIYSTSYEFNNNISISNSTFISNQANTDSRRFVHFCDQPSVAGTIAVFQSKLNITNCTFTNNTSETGEGGVLAIQQQSTLSICKSKFYGNNAKNYGGVFMIRETSATINSSVRVY
jgi:predicted outer membrane repeat protein